MPARRHFAAPGGAAPLLLLALLLAAAPRAVVRALSVEEHGWISVAHRPAVDGAAAQGGAARDERYVLVDEAGREVLLRGVNLCLQQWRPAGDDRPIDPARYADGACPPNNKTTYMNPPICGVDAGAVRASSHILALLSSLVRARARALTRAR